MLFLWSKSSKVGSKLIRWGTNSDCSHFAIGFNDIPGHGDCVLESTYPKGVRIIGYEGWRKNNHICHLIQVPLHPNDEINLFLTAETRLKDKQYDENAIKYWTARIILNKLLFVPMPNENKWGDHNKVYCVEVLDALKDFLASRGVTFNKEVEMMYPHESFEILRKIRSYSA